MIVGNWDPGTFTPEELFELRGETLICEDLSFK
jgi:hypothetical protein